MSLDRSENRKKRLKMLMVFGSTSAALTVAAAVLGWTWDPLSANWTLPPQPTVEDAEAPKSVDNRWSALRMPVAPISGPLAKTDSPIETPPDETMVMADLGSSFAAIQPSAGPSEDSNDGTNEFTFGLNPSNYNFGGGSGNSWRGTIHPNNSSGPGGLSMPSYSSGGGGTGAGNGTSDDQKNEKEIALKPDEGDSDDPDDPNGSCVGYTVTVGGSGGEITDTQDCGQPNGNGNTDNQNGGDNSSCVGWNSSVSVPGQTANNGASCGQQNAGNDGDDEGGNEGEDGVGGSCIVSTSVIGGQTVTSYSAGCQMPPPTSPVTCLSEEGCGDPNGPPAGTVIAVPEPGTLALFLSGVAGLLLVRRRR